jgi:hypothetical protein
MSRLLPVFAAFVMLVTVGAVRASFEELLFKDPTGGVLCDAFEWHSVERGTIECAVTSTGSATRYPKQWFLRVRGPVSVRRPDNGPVGRNRMIPYGSILRLGLFRCAMLKAGLRCTSRLSGHGFELSRTRQRVF